MEPHTTYMEMRYIDGLGSWSENKYRRIELLKKYIKSADKRKEWSGMHKGHVMEHAWKALNEERESLNG